MKLDITATDFLGSTCVVKVDLLIEECPVCRVHVAVAPLIAFLNGDRDKSSLLEIVHRCPRRACGRAFFKHGLPCLICGEPDALVGYFWTGGRVVYLHAARATYCKERGESSPPVGGEETAVRVTCT